MNDLNRDELTSIMFALTEYKFVLAKRNKQYGVTLTGSKADLDYWRRNDKGLMEGIISAQPKIENQLRVLNEKMKDKIQIKTPKGIMYFLEEIGGEII